MTKTVECKTCDDTNWIVCPYCEGEYDDICCNGSSRLNCPDCNADGNKEWVIEKIQALAGVAILFLIILYLIFGGNE